MQQISLDLRKKGFTLGFVPTMGFLHEGHISLIENSKSKCDKTIVSIFVNPTQFSQNEDFSFYPRNFDKDNKILIDSGVDYLFFPTSEEIYPNNFQTFITVEEISKKYEGEFRPEHFKGVATVVAVLFNIVNPDVVYFGRKDAQQCAIIKQMTKDLRFNTKIEICTTKRESDGLAMSSRNVYLSEDERKKAAEIYKSLLHGINLILNGERKTDTILEEINNKIKSATSSIDYIRIVNSDSFEEVYGEIMKGEYYILIACKIGNTRLIDNEIFEVS